MHGSFRRVALGRVAALVISVATIAAATTAVARAEPGGQRRHPVPPVVRGRPAARTRSRLSPVTGSAWSKQGQNGRPRQQAPVVCHECFSSCVSYGRVPSAVRWECAGNGGWRAGCVPHTLHGPGPSQGHSLNRIKPAQQAGSPRRRGRGSAALRVVPCQAGLAARGPRAAKPRGLLSVPLPVWELPRLPVWELPRLPVWELPRLPVRELPRPGGAAGTARAGHRPRPSRR
jgi:hypothetical protein